MVDAFWEVNREDEGRRECICRGDVATKKAQKIIEKQPLGVLLPKIICTGCLPDPILVGGNSCGLGPVQDSLGTNPGMRTMKSGGGP